MLHDNAFCDLYTSIVHPLQCKARTMQAL